MLPYKYTADKAREYNRLSVGLNAGIGRQTGKKADFQGRCEYINLAIMLELPLVIVNVQHGGSSTGLPT